MNNKRWDYWQVIFKAKLKRCFLVLFLFLLPNMYVHANPEVLIGITAQGAVGSSVAELEIGLNFQFEKVTKDKGYSVKIKFFPNEESVLSLLQKGQLDGYFGTSSFFFKHQQYFNSDSLFAPIFNNGIKQSYLLLVRNESEIDSVAMLKKTKLSYSETDEVGLLYLKQLLKKEGMGELHNAFNEVLRKRNPNLAVSALFFKQVDAVLMLENDFMVASELNPQIKKQLKIIKRSPEYITHIFATTTTLTGAISKREIEDTVFEVGNADENKNYIGYQGLRRVQLEEFNNIRALVQDEDKTAKTGR